MTVSYQIFPVGFVRKKGHLVTLEIKKGFEEACWAWINFRIFMCCTGLIRTMSQKSEALCASTPRVIKCFPVDSLLCAVA